MSSLQRFYLALVKLKIKIQIKFGVFSFLIFKYATHFCPGGLYFSVWEIFRGFSSSLTSSFHSLSLYASPFHTLSLSLYLSLSYLSLPLYISPSTFLSLSLLPSLLSIILFGISNGRFIPCFTGESQKTISLKGNWILKKAVRGKPVFLQQYLKVHSYTLQCT